MIHSQERFEQEVLGKYFKHKKTASFLRQANMYYMRKFGEVGWLEFGHEDSLLHRDYPERVWDIKRRPRDAAAAAAATGQIVPVSDGPANAVVVTVVGELSDIVRTMAEDLPATPTATALKRRLDVLMRTCDSLVPRPAKRSRMAASGSTSHSASTSDADEDGSWNDEDEDEPARRGRPAKVRRSCADRRGGSSAAATRQSAAATDEVTSYTLSPLDDVSPVPPMAPVSTMVPLAPQTAMPYAANLDVLDFDGIDNAFGGKPFPAAADHGYVPDDDAGAAAVPLSPTSELSHGGEWAVGTDEPSDALYYGKALSAERNCDAMPPCAGTSGTIISRDREGRVTLRTASMT